MLLFSPSLFLLAVDQNCGFASHLSFAVLELALWKYPLRVKDLLLLKYQLSVPEELWIEEKKVTPMKKSHIKKHNYLDKSLKAACSSFKLESLTYV